MEHKRTHSSGWLGLLSSALPIYTLYPLLLGQMPWSHDHTVHLFKSIQFFEEILPRGAVSGWSNIWFFGYPASDLYAPSIEVWVALVRILTLKALSWEATYAIAFLVAMQVMAYATYRFGAHFISPLVGFIAAILFTLDPGEWMQGGWGFTVDFGVWAQPFAVALVFLGLVELDRWRLRQGRYAPILAPLLLGMALLTHPFGLIQVSLCVGLYALAIHPALQGRPSEFPIEPWEASLLKLAYGGVSALLIGAGWLLPFLTRSQWAEDQGSILLGAEDVLMDTFTGTLLGNGWPLILYAALGGMALAVLRGGYGHRLMALIGSASILLCSLWTAEMLTLIHPLFGRVQWERILIGGKLPLFSLAAYGGVSLVTQLRGWARGPGGDGRRLPAMAGLGGLGLITLGMLGTDLVAAQTRLSQLPLSGEAQAWRDAEALKEWEASLDLEAEGFFRILLLLKAHDHTLMAVPGYSKIPHFRVGYTPARSFRHNPEMAYPPMLTLLGVKYVVSRAPQEGPHIEKITTLRGLHVYRFLGYQPRRFTLRGRAEATPTRFDPEHIAFDITDAEPGASLTLHVSNYLRWEATLNGEVVPISARNIPTPEMRPILMEVPIEEGTLEFRYVHRWADTAGLASMALGVLLALLTPFVFRQRPEGATSIPG